MPNRLNMLTAVIGLAGALGVGAPAAAPTHPTHPARGVHMVAFGDSVASGSHCSCSPFPYQYAKKVGAHIGRTVHMHDLAFPGATTDDVVDQLRTAPVRSAVRRSGTVLVMIGANDFAEAFQQVLAGQQSSTAAFPPVAGHVRRTVTGVIDTIKRLHRGVHVVVGDYWNVMKDGRVGLSSYGPWGERKAVEATQDANGALHRAATATGATYVSTYRPFKGKDGRRDPTGLLASDGDHPNAAGHAVIARAFFRAASRG